MADTVGSRDDLELDVEGNGGAVSQSPSVRKNIPLKLKGKARGGRARKVGRGSRKSGTKSTKAEPDKEDDPEEEKVLDQTTDVVPEKPRNLSYEEESNAIAKLETPTFTTLERNFTEPLHQNKQLSWNHKVNLIGEKLLYPMIHCCECCSLPILIYGRMIPCKHVFCLDCAKSSSKKTKCPRCEFTVSRVEPSSLGTVFICMHGSSLHSTSGCRRTYLSQRDLQAHISHRHDRQPTQAPSRNTSTNSGSSSVPSTTGPNSVPPPPPQAPPLTARDPRGPHIAHEGPSHTPPHAHPPLGHSLPPPHLPEYRQEDRPPPLLPNVANTAIPPPPANRPSQHLYSHPPPISPAHAHPSYPNPIPVVSTRSNLITVPIQDDSSSSSPHMHPPPQLHLSSPYASQSPQHPPPQHPPPVAPYSAPPPQPTHHYPPSHSSQPPPYSQPQNFNPPTHIPPPAIHNPNAPPPLFTAPPPSVHHPPPPVPPYNNPPPIRTHSLPPPPQRFPGPSNYDDRDYPPSWGGSRPPPPTQHQSRPPSQSESGYRPAPPYYP